MTGRKGKGVTDALIEHVSDTAFWVAHDRALETERVDALFRDRFAGLLAGERGKQIAQAMPMTSISGWAIVIRTCIIDDYIRFAIAQGADMVLNLGAGLDARPYRMDLPQSLVWVEADYPEVIKFKEKRLSSEKPRCQLERVKLDLTNFSDRRSVFATLNARAKKMLVLTEGVIPYLSVEDVGSLADDLKALDHACYWIVDHYSPKIIKYLHRSRMGQNAFLGLYLHRRGMRQKMQNAPFKFKPADWFAFFAEHGWHCKEIRYLAAEGERLRRPIQLPLFLKVILRIRGLFASQKQRAALRKLSGYVMLEPRTAILKP
jgi:methyltransferase (TIGR00027 family)